MFYQCKLKFNVTIKSKNKTAKNKSILKDKRSNHLKQVTKMSLQIKIVKVLS